MNHDWGVALETVSLPTIALPRTMPVVPTETYEARIRRAYDVMQERGLDALVVYGDREHFANTAFLTGFDPRYEESILILIPGRRPRLLVGNENVGYASRSGIDMDIVRLAKLSLQGQPDPGDVSLMDCLADAGLDSGAVERIGLVGWKYYAGSGTEGWIDMPHYLVEAFRALSNDIVNAADIFTATDRGLRIINDVDQIAYFEFAASHASTAVSRLISGIRPGMTELEASALMSPIMLPFNYHPTTLGGYENTGYGVASPGNREFEIGDPVCAGLGYWGSNTARAGFLVEDISQLPEMARDYVDRVVTPYFATAAAWYETITIGLTAGELFEVTNSRIGDDFYGVYLNPGHFIHLDEWPASPVAPGNPTVFQSGNTIQVDIIAATGGALHTVQIEDGVALADDDLRAQFARAYPEAYARTETRRSMLADVFGIRIHDDVLPLSNTAGYLPPYWLAPHLAMVKK